MRVYPDNRIISKLYMGLRLNRAGSARGNKNFLTYLCRAGAGAPPVGYPWRNRASGIPLANYLAAVMISRTELKVNAKYLIEST